MGLSSSQLRAEYSSARCNTAKMVRTEFPCSSAISSSGTISLLVETSTVAAWRLFRQIMDKHGYLFRESAGGTYNCRLIAGSSNYSLHSYGLALDLNPSKNPYSRTLVTDMPKSFRDDLKKIKTGNGKQVFEWGGDWSGSKDSMHWEIDVTRSDLATGVSHPDAASKPTTPTEPDEPTEEDNMLPLEKGDGTGDRAHKKQDVRALQYLLNHTYGCTLTNDGVYGDATRLAVRHAQSTSQTKDNNGAVVDGECWGRLVFQAGGRDGSTPGKDEYHKGGDPNHTPGVND